MKVTNYIKCDVCGKFISYADIPDNVEQSYTPETEYTTEDIGMWHKECPKSSTTKAG